MTDEADNWDFDDHLVDDIDVGSNPLPPQTSQPPPDTDHGAHGDEGDGWDDDDDLGLSDSFGADDAHVGTGTESTTTARPSGHESAAAATAVETHPEPYHHGAGMPMEDVPDGAEGWDDDDDDLGLDDDNFGGLEEGGNSGSDTRRGADAVGVEGRSEPYHHGAATPTEEVPDGAGGWDDGDGDDLGLDDDDDEEGDGGHYGNRGREQEDGVVAAKDRQVHDATVQETIAEPTEPTQPTQQPVPHPTTPSPGKAAAAARLFGSGLGILSAARTNVSRGLTNVAHAVADAAVPDYEAEYEEEEGEGWDEEDDDLFSDEEVEVEEEDDGGGRDGEHGGAGQEFAQQEFAQLHQEDHDQEPEPEQPNSQPPPPPPPPPFPSVLPTASRWGAAMAATVAPPSPPAAHHPRQDEAQPVVPQGETPTAPSDSETDQQPQQQPQTPTQPQRGVWPEGQAHQTRQQEQEDDDEQEAREPTVKVGTGLFMGRLTRLIESAAAPAASHASYSEQHGMERDEEDEDQDTGGEGGWDDDGLETLDDDLAHDDGIAAAAEEDITKAEGEQQTPAAVVSDSAAPAPSLGYDTVPTSPDFDGGAGWTDDDDGLDELDDLDEVGSDDDATPAPAPGPPAAPSRSPPSSVSAPSVEPPPPAAQADQGLAPAAAAPSPPAPVASTLPLSPSDLMMRATLHTPRDAAAAASSYGATHAAASGTQPPNPLWDSYDPEDAAGSGSYQAGLSGPRGWADVTDTIVLDGAHGEVTMAASFDDPTYASAPRSSVGLREAEAEEEQRRMDELEGGGTAELEVEAVGLPLSGMATPREEVVSSAILGELNSSVPMPVPVGHGPSTEMHPASEAAAIIPPPPPNAAQGDGEGWVDDSGLMDGLDSPVPPASGAEMTAAVPPAPVPPASAPAASPGDLSDGGGEEGWGDESGLLDGLDSPVRSPSHPTAIAAAAAFDPSAAPPLPQPSLTGGEDTKLGMDGASIDGAKQGPAQREQEATEEEKEEEELQEIDTESLRALSTRREFGSPAPSVSEYDLGDFATTVSEEEANNSLKGGGGADDNIHDAPPLASSTPQPRPVAADSSSAAGVGASTRPTRTQQKDEDEHEHHVEFDRATILSTLTTVGPDRTPVPSLSEFEAEALAEEPIQEEDEGAKEDAEEGWDSVPPLAYEGAEAEEADSEIIETESLRALSIRKECGSPPPSVSELDDSIPVETMQFEKTELSGSRDDSGADDAVAMEQHEQPPLRVTTSSEKEEKKQDIATLPDVEETVALCAQCRAPSGECPCLEQVLSHPHYLNGGIVTEDNPTDGGPPVEINYRKLLQNEIAKRLLLEKRIEADTRTMESLQDKVDAADGFASERERMHADRVDGLSLRVQELTESNENLARTVERKALQIESLEQERDEAIAKVDAVVAGPKEVIDATEMSALFEKEKRAWVERTTRLEKEVSVLRRTVDMADASTSGERESLSAEVTSLQYELDGKTSECGEVTARLQEVQGKLRDVEGRCSSQAADLAQQSQHLMAEIESLRGKADALEGERDRALELSNESAGEAETLSSEVASLRYELEDKVQQCEEATAMRESAQDKVRDLEARFSSQAKDAAAEVRELNRQIKLLEDELASLRLERDSFLSEREDLVRAHEEALGRFDNELRDIKGVTEALQRERDESAAKLEMSTREHIEELNKNLGQLRELEEINAFLEKEKNALEMDVVNLSTTQEAVDANNAELISLREERDSLHSEVLTATSRFEELERQHAASLAKVETIEMDRDATVSRYHDLEQSMERMEAEASMNEAEVSALEKEIEDVVGQRDKLSSRCYELEQQMQIIMSEKPVNEVNAEAPSTAEDTLSRLQAELQSLTVAKTSLLSEKEALVSRCRTLETKSADDHEGIQQLRNEIHILTEERDRLSTERGEIRVQCVQLVEKVETMKSTLRQNDDELESRGETILRLRKECAQLRASKDDAINEKEIKISQLQGDLTDLSDEQTKLNSERDRLQSRVGTLEEEMLGIKSSLVEKDKLIRIREDALQQLREEEASGKDDRDRIVSDKEDIISKLQRDLESLRDAHESHCSALENELESQSLKLAEKEKEVEERESTIEQLNMEGSTSALDDNVEEMAKRCRENDAIILALQDEISSANEGRERLELENEELLVQLGLLHQQVASLENQIQIQAEGDNGSTVSAHESNGLRQTVQELEKEIVRLRDQLKCLEEEGAEISHLLEENEESQASLHAAEVKPAEEVSAQNGREELQSMRVQVEQLTALCSERAQEIAEKDSLISRLRKELDMAVEEKIASEKELSANRDEIMSLDVALLKTEMARDDEKQASAAVNEHKSRISELEQALAKKDEEISSIESQKRACEVKVLEIQSKLDEGLSASDPSHVNAMEQAISEKDIQITEAQKQILELQVDLATKDHELQSVSVKKQCETESASEIGSDQEALKVALKDKEEELLARLAQIDSLSTELEGFRANLMMNQEIALRIAETTRGLSASLSGLSSKEKAESADYMRAQIISLAAALENSEIKRAESLERIVQERRTNSDSLRKLGESVKRFYSALSCGD